MPFQNRQRGHSGNSGIGKMSFDGQFHCPQISFSISQHLLFVLSHFSGFPKMEVCQEYYGLPPPPVGFGQPLQLSRGDIIELTRADVDLAWWEVKPNPSKYLSGVISSLVSCGLCVDVRFCSLFLCLWHLILHIPLPPSYQTCTCARLQSGVWFTLMLLILKLYVIPVSVCLNRLCFIFPLVVTLVPCFTV